MLTFSLSSVVDVRIAPFVDQQPALAVESDRIASERAVRTNDPVAWNHDRNGIARVGEPHGAAGSGFA